MKIGIVTGLIEPHFSLEECYAIIADAGFTSIDWSLNFIGNLRKHHAEGTCIFEKSLEQVIARYSEELSIIAKYGLTISQAHAPFPAFYKGYPELTEYCIKIYKRIIELCAYANCKILVIHPISISPMEMEETPQTVYERNMHLFESLIPYAVENNVTICLENLWEKVEMNKTEGACSDPYAAAMMIDTLNQKAGKEIFGICIDTGHLNLLGKDPRTFLPILGDRIKALHINDNNGTSDQHLTPLCGNFNWQSFCDTIKEIGYKGDLCFETIGQTIKTLDFDKELLAPWLKLIYTTGEKFREKILG